MATNSESRLSGNLGKVKTSTDLVALWQVFLYSSIVPDLLLNLFFWDYGINWLVKKKEMILVITANDVNFKIVIDLNSLFRSATLLFFSFSESNLLTFRALSMFDLFLGLELFSFSLFFFLSCLTFFISSILRGSFFT